MATAISATIRSIWFGTPEYTNKDASETCLYQAVFGDLKTTETITGCTCTVSVISGTDASASSRLSGSPVILTGAQGAKVQQLFAGGVSGVTYQLSWTATTSTPRTLGPYVVNLTIN